MHRLVIRSLALGIWLAAPQFGATARLARLKPVFDFCSILEVRQYISENVRLSPAEDQYQIHRATGGGFPERLPSGCFSIWPVLYKWRPKHEYVFVVW